MRRTSLANSSASRLQLVCAGQPASKRRSLGTPTTSPLLSGANRLPSLFTSRSARHHSLPLLTPSPFAPLCHRQLKCAKVKDRASRPLRRRRCCTTCSITPHGHSAAAPPTWREARAPRARGSEAFLRKSLAFRFCIRRRRCLLRAKCKAAMEFAARYYSLHRVACGLHAARIYSTLSPRRVHFFSSLYKAPLPCTRSVLLCAL